MQMQMRKGKAIWLEEMVKSGAPVESSRLNLSSKTVFEDQQREQLVPILS